MDRDALINDFIRLKERPAAPVERWQMVATVRRSVSAKNLVTMAQPSSPLKQITNIQDNDFPKTPKTPQCGRLVVRAKSSNKKQRSKTLENSTTTTTTTTPGLHKTPRTFHRTPGRGADTPSGCRFIPNG
jgi:hypothetical protein